MTFEEAVKAKAKKRWFWRYFAPYFLAMFKVWAVQYLKDCSPDEAERFRCHWL